VANDTASFPVWYGTPRGYPTECGLIRSFYIMCNMRQHVNQIHAAYLHVPFQLSHPTPQIFIVRLLSEARMDNQMRKQTTATPHKEHGEHGSRLTECQPCHRDSFYRSFELPEPSQSGHVYTWQPAKAVTLEIAPCTPACDNLRAGPLFGIILLQHTNNALP
jgi:hypothetical protein